MESKESQVPLFGLPIEPWVRPSTSTSDIQIPTAMAASKCRDPTFRWISVSRKGPETSSSEWSYIEAPISI